MKCFQTCLQIFWLYCLCWTPQFSVPFFFTAYPWRRSSMNWLQQPRLSVRPFLAHQWNGWMGSLVQLIHQTSWSEQPVRLQELQFCTQAGQVAPLCPSKCITWWAQVIFLQPYHKTSKNQALWMFVCHSPRNDLLPFYGQREPAGAPQREASLSEPWDQQQQDAGRKDNSQKETVPSHAGLQLGAL